MSAFVVSKTHIDALITAGLSRRAPSYPGDSDPPLRWLLPFQRVHEGATPRGELTLETADRVGQMLWDNNQLSVTYLYKEDGVGEEYRFQHLGGKPDPVIVLKAIACYRYQSCEHPEWELSEAAAFCYSLERRMIERLPGYDEAPGWEISDRNVFLR